MSMWGLLPAGWWPEAWAEQYCRAPCQQGPSRPGPGRAAADLLGAWHAHPLAHSSAQAPDPDTAADSAAAAAALHASAFLHMQGWLCTLKFFILRITKIVHGAEIRDGLSQNRSHISKQLDGAAHPGAACHWHCFQRPGSWRGCPEMRLVQSSVLQTPEHLHRSLECHVPDR